MFTNPTSSIISAADTSAENAAQSFGDRVQNPNVKITPTMDPNSFIKQSQDLNQASFNAAGLPQAFQRSSMSGKQAQDALDFVAEKYKQDEMKKLPLEDMKAERDRLMSAKFRILPDMLARTDIIDYKQKINLANQLIGTYNSEISTIDQTRSDLEKKAEERAKMKVSEMQAKADLLKQKAQDDRLDLQSRIDLYKIGQSSLQDILEKAVSMQETQDKLSKEAANNPFISDPGEPMIAGFTKNEIDLFLQYEKFGDWNIPDSVKTQYGMQLSMRYANWVRAGRPTGLETQGLYGPPSADGQQPFNVQSANDPNFMNPFEVPSKARKLLSPQDQLIQSLSDQIKAGQATPEGF